jgi:hypothetical protein
VTLVTVLSIVAVVSVYAVLIGAFIGGDVTVGNQASGNIMYSSSNTEPGTWTTILGPGVGSAWYARLEIPVGGYSGPVTVSWHLEKRTGPLAADWTDVSGAIASTSLVLDSTARNIYASGDGALTGNHNWGPDVAVAGTYRVLADVNSV